MPGTTRAVGVLTPLALLLVLGTALSAQSMTGFAAPRTAAERSAQAAAIARPDSVRAGALGVDAVFSDHPGDALRTAAAFAPG